jgi:hypothetical protein
MSIAMNANKPTFSVRRSGRAGCDLFFKSVSAPPNGEGGIWLFQNYKHLAPNGAKTRVYLPPTPCDGPSIFESLTVVGLAGPAPWQAP